MSRKNQWSRRGFLGAMGAGAAALALGRRAHAQSLPCSCGSVSPGPKILELFFAGGMPHWDIFWLAPQSGTSGALEWHGINVAGTNPAQDDFWRSPDLTAVAPITPNACYSLLNGLGITSATDQLNLLPAAGETKPFGVDALGREIHWGPATKPLWSLLGPGGAGARMLVTRHNLPVHQLAVPHMLTGYRLGNPRLAGTGSVIDHVLRYQAGNLAAPPTAYVVTHKSPAWPYGPGPNHVTSAPIVIRLDTYGASRTALDRNALVSAGDPLLAAITASVRGRFVAQGGLDPIRSEMMEAFEGVRDQSSKLRSTMLPVDTTLGETDATLCPGNGQSLTSPENLYRNRQGLRVAAELLQGAVDANLDTLYAARHCLVEIKPAGFNSFDLHSTVSYDPANRVTSTLLAFSGVYSTFLELRRLVTAGKLCLDCTMLVMTTDFNRTPLAESAGYGRNHWANGQVSVLVGGGSTLAPTTSGLLGTIHGTIDGSGYAQTAGDLSDPAQAATLGSDLRGALNSLFGVDAFDTVIRPRRFSANDFSRNFVTNSALRQTIFGQS